MLYEVEVKVRLKPGVLDPQGAAVAGALQHLGYEGIPAVRIGKLVEMQVEAADEAAARRQVEAVGRRLLANPVLEDFTFTLAPARQEVAR